MLDQSERAAAAVNASSRSPAAGRGGWLARLRLRWLVLALTLAGVLAFVALALADRRVAPLALAGALFIALKGLGWLLYLRRSRARLRRNGLRW